MSDWQRAVRHRQGPNHLRKGRDAVEAGGKIAAGHHLFRMQDPQQDVARRGRGIDLRHHRLVVADTPLRVINEADARDGRQPFAVALEGAQRYYE